MPEWNVTLKFLEEYEARKCLNELHEQGRFATLSQITGMVRIEHPRKPLLNEMDLLDVVKKYIEVVDRREELSSEIKHRTGMEPSELLRGLRDLLGDSVRL